ncbi:MAG: methyltransferase domain-containing protein [Deltaproteobacteria bacterium]|nr:methyltransferase domain-containing protein [Deltaproteobacteria bacterium]
MTEPSDPEKRFNERASVYDDEIEKIIPGYRALHDISHHILKSALPQNAYILVGGSGTGKEAIEYAVENPGWKITGFDIAEEMVKTASSKIEQNGLCSRIELIHGGIEDIMQESFDGATSLLVMHFLPKEDKSKYLKEICFRLKDGGKFILADVGGDRNTPEFEEFLPAWKSFQLQTRDKKDVDEMLQHVRGNLNFITLDETIFLLKDSGFRNIRHFWKSLLINGFVMEKGR